MTALPLRMLNLLLVGLIAGILFGIWIGYNPATLSAEAYLEQQQNAINALNTLMPLLGFIAIIMTLVFAYTQKSNRQALMLLLAAAALLICSGLVTRFGNQPINSIVITWTKETIPANWGELRDNWWSFHQLRTVTTVAAFTLISWINLDHVRFRVGPHG